MKSANNFYNEQVTKDGRGRFLVRLSTMILFQLMAVNYSATEDQSDAEDEAKEDLQGIDSNGDGDYDDTGEIAPSMLTTIVRKHYCGLQYLEHKMKTLLHLVGLILAMKKIQVRTITMKMKLHPVLEQKNF